VLHSSANMLAGYLIENPQTGGPIKDVKTAWRYALRDAGITDLRVHDSLTPSAFGQSTGSSAERGYRGDESRGHRGQQCAMFMRLMTANAER